VSERKVSGKLVHGLWGRALAGELPGGLLSTLASKGLDPTQVHREVSWTLFHQGVVETAEALFPGRPDQLERLGARVVECLRHEIPGAVLTVGKMMGVRSVLKRAVGQPLRGIEWLTLHLDERGKRELAITVNEPVATGFLAGALGALFKVFGERPTVAVERPGCVAVRW